MALKNHGELKAALANYLDREDQELNIPTFIKLAETKVYRVLRSSCNEFTASYDETTVPASFNPIALPQNFREMHLCMLNGKPLDHISSQEYFTRKRTGYTGAEAWFCVIGQEMFLFPWADAEEDLGDSFAIDIIYFGSESISEMATWQTPRNPNSVPESDGTAADTTMRSDEATTRLLLVAPDVLLYGALVEAYRFLREPAKMAEYKSLFVETITDLRMESDSALFSGSTSTVSSVYADGEQF